MKMTTLTEMEILQDLLIAEKFLLGMYKQYGIEASNMKLKNLLIDNMNNVFELQFKAFEMMHERNLYPTEEAEINKIVSTIKTIKENSKDYKI